MTTDVLYRPSDVARLVDVSASTIRNWTRDYAEFFTESARGESGERLYTDQDVSVVKYVAQLRQDRMSRKAILLHLRETGIEGDETPFTAQPTEQKEAAEGTRAALQIPAREAQEAPYAPQMPALVVDMLNAQIASVRYENAETRRRVAALETQSSSRGSALAYGIILGIGASIVLAAVLSLMFG